MLPLDGPFRPDRLGAVHQSPGLGQAPDNPRRSARLAGKHNSYKGDAVADSKGALAWLCAIASAAFIAVSAAIAPLASAQGTGPQVRTGPAQWIDMKNAPEVAPVAAPADLAINRPTMPMADYIAAKNAAAHAPGQAKPGVAPPVSSNVTLYTQVGSTNETQTTGGNQFPPDGDIATSSQWMVQVNNDVIVMYNWITNAFVSKHLSTFFQDGTNFLFDPRVVYDPNWDRFVVMTDGCNPCSGAGTVSIFNILVSATGDPTDGFWLVRSQPNATGDFADFPQMGLDLNSVIITYNNFGPTGFFTDSRIFAIPKAYLYNGKPFLAPTFTGGSCTIAPPYVLDNSGVDYLLQFCPNAYSVAIGSMRDSGLSTVNVTPVDNTVAVSNFGIPPDAVQPAPNAAFTLDTGDNRFENRSLQVGNRIINTATVNSGTPTPAWYIFNIGETPHTEVGDSYFYAPGSQTYDWHPAINANTVGAPPGTPLGEIFLTWMSTNPTAGINVQLRAAGGLGDSPATGATGIPIFTSAFGLTNQSDTTGRHRTGDYAYIATYPAAALGCASANEIGILVGETVGPAAGTWGTHVGIVKHC
jgi:hypothetical protein